MENFIIKTFMIRYRVSLTQEEREELMAIISKGSHTAQQYRNAYILLNCDEGAYGNKIINEEISHYTKLLNQGKQKG